MRQYCLIVLQATLSAERRSGHTVTNELFESLLLRLSGQRGEPKNEALISPDLTKECDYLALFPRLKRQEEEKGPGFSHSLGPGMRLVIIAQHR